MTGQREPTGEAHRPEREPRRRSVLERLQSRPLVMWSCVLVVTLVAFYLMNHAIMAGQGLPLNLDLSPAQ